MNARQRRQVRRHPVEHGYGPRHAFNAQEGSEEVPMPDNFGPGWQLQRALHSARQKIPGAAQWFLNEVRQGILSDEDIAEIKRNPGSVQSLQAMTNAIIMLNPEFAGRGGPRMPKSPKIPPPGLKKFDPAPRYEGPEPPPKSPEFEPGTGFGSSLVKGPEPGSPEWFAQKAKDFQAKHGFPPPEGLFQKGGPPPEGGFKSQPKEPGGLKDQLQKYNEAMEKYAHGEPLDAEEAGLIHDVESNQEHPDPELMKYLEEYHGPQFEWEKGLPPETDKALDKPFDVPDDGPDPFDTGKTPSWHELSPEGQEQFFKEGGFKDKLEAAMNWDYYAGHLPENPLDPPQSQIFFDKPPPKEKSGDDVFNNIMDSLDTPFGEHPKDPSFPPEDVQKMEDLQDFLKPDEGLPQGSKENTDEFWQNWEDVVHNRNNPDWKKKLIDDVLPPDEKPLTWEEWIKAADEQTAKDKIDKDPNKFREMDHPQDNPYEPGTWQYKAWQDKDPSLFGPEGPPPEEPPLPPWEPGQPRFKKGTKAVRKNPKKVGRPHKIGVEKGFGPRHAANAKEGEDLTQINTDTVPAMLTPREAVLNRNAAELMGREEIEQLNAQGNELAKKGVDLAAEGDSDVPQRPQLIDPADWKGATPFQRQSMMEFDALMQKLREREKREPYPKEKGPKFDPKLVPTIEDIPLRRYEPSLGEENLQLMAQSGLDEVPEETAGEIFFKRPMRSVEKTISGAIPRNLQELTEMLVRMSGKDGPNTPFLGEVVKGAVGARGLLEKLLPGSPKREPTGSQEWWDAAVPVGASYAGMMTPGGAPGLKILKNAQQAMPKTNWPQARYEVHVDQRLGEFDRHLGDIAKQEGMAPQELLEKAYDVKTGGGPTTLEEFGKIRKAKEQKQATEQRTLEDQQRKLDEDSASGALQERARKKFHERGSYKSLQDRRVRTLESVESKMNPEQREQLRQYDQSHPREDTGLKREPLPREDKYTPMTFTSEPEPLPGLTDPRWNDPKSNGLVGPQAEKIKAAMDKFSREEDLTVDEAKMLLDHETGQPEPNMEALQAMSRAAGGKGWDKNKPKIGPNDEPINPTDPDSFQEGTESVPARLFKRLQEYYHQKMTEREIPSLPKQTIYPDEKPKVESQSYPRRELEGRKTGMSSWADYMKFLQNQPPNEALLSEIEEDFIEKLEETRLRPDLDDRMVIDPDDPLPPSTYVPERPPERLKKGTKDMKPKQKPTGYQGGDDAVRRNPFPNRGPGGVYPSMPGLGTGQPGQLGQPPDQIGGFGGGLGARDEFGRQFSQRDESGSFGRGNGVPGQLGQPSPWGKGPFSEPPRSPMGAYPMQVPQPAPWQPSPGPMTNWGPSKPFYPPGQGLRMAGGESDVTNIGEAPVGQEAYSKEPFKFSSPDLSSFLKSMMEQAKQQGFNPQQIAGMVKAFQGGGGGSNFSSNANVAASADVTGQVPYGLSGYSGGISEVGWPPMISPGAEFHYDKGGWVGKYDNDFMIPTYQGGTSQVQGHQFGVADKIGERDLWGAGPDRPFSGGFRRNFEPHYQSPPGFGTSPPSGFGGPTRLPTTWSWQGGQFGWVPHALPASGGSDWDRGGPHPHTPPKNKG